jgi:hypothetical protein
MHFIFLSPFFPIGASSYAAAVVLVHHHRTRHVTNLGEQINADT